WTAERLSGTASTLVLARCSCSDALPAVFLCRRLNRHAGLATNRTRSQSVVPPSDARRFERCDNGGVAQVGLFERYIVMGILEPLDLLRRRPKPFEVGGGYVGVHVSIVPTEEEE